MINTTKHCGLKLAVMFIAHFTVLKKVSWTWSITGGPCTLGPRFFVILKISSLVTAGFQPVKRFSQRFITRFDISSASAS